MRAPSSNAKFNTGTLAGPGGSTIGSYQTVPVNQSDDAFFVGRDLTFIIFINTLIHPMLFFNGKPSSDTLEQFEIPGWAEPGTQVDIWVLLSKVTLVLI